MNNNSVPITDAEAVVTGSKKYPDIRGRVTFHQIGKGVIVTANIHGLPRGEKCKNGIFAFHIHEGTECSPTGNDSFSNTHGHYNPGGCPHPYHAGDLPPLFGNGGFAYMSVLTDRFTVSEIIGRTVIIHSRFDDFTTQPSGNAGEKIACGKIRTASRYR